MQDDLKNLTVEGPFVSVNEDRFRRESDAETIQAAIDEARGSDATVVLPRFNAAKNRSEWRIGRAIVLRTGTRLLLDNAFLVQETGSYDHLFTNEPGAENIVLFGEGFATLSGGQENRLREKTANRYGLPDVMKNVMIYLSGAKHVTLQNLRIEHQRYHAVAADLVEDLTIRNIDFFAYPHLPNMGGIVLRNQTKRVRIENVTGRTGDDVILLRDGNEIGIRNVLADPARASLVRIEPESGRKVGGVRIDTLMDGSRFYEKKRSGAVLAFYRENGRAEGGTKASGISDVQAGNLYSRSERAIAVDGAFSDTKIRNLMTFGDNIYAVASRAKEPVECRNAAIEGVFYGAGSLPNNSGSFISLQARGAKPLVLENVRGLEVTGVLFPDEERS